MAASERANGLGTILVNDHAWWFSETRLWAQNLGKRMAYRHLSGQVFHFRTYKATSVGQLVLDEGIR